MNVTQQNHAAERAGLYAASSWVAVRIRLIGERLAFGATRPEHRTRLIWERAELRAEQKRLQTEIEAGRYWWIHP